ncbi:hypothetical protein T11_2963 [Trichinella zimbabwensis]|uniref:Uncharacterized protein n=1 Tax=Trichinella zimbabwensis TaxID=268475 RepID=A0A0V1GRM5_9BILA|nr:hypothetical protein T11_2963 [Trichinella zimbabwensis]
MSSGVLSYWPSVAYFCCWKSWYSMYNPRRRISANLVCTFGSPGGSLLYARNFIAGLFPTTCSNAFANECPLLFASGAAPSSHAPALPARIIFPKSSCGMENIQTLRNTPCFILLDILKTAVDLWLSEHTISGGS